MSCILKITFFGFILCGAISCSEISAAIEEVYSPIFSLDEDCLDLTNVSKEDVDLIQSFRLPITSEGRCLLACLFKKINIITPEGSYNHDGCLSAVRSVLDFHPKALEKAIEVVDHCSVKLEEMVDESGCEIATTLYSCVIEEINDQEFDFDSSEYLN